MRNAELEKLGGLVGEWTTTISNAWFLEPSGAEVRGSTTVDWLGESFLVVRSRLDEALSRGPEPRSSLAKMRG